MNCFVRAKLWYLSLLGKNKRNFFEQLFYWFLFFLSFVYGGIVCLRNFVYDKKIFPVICVPHRNIISIGNISWAGTGKTTLALYLYDKLFPKFNIAILRRGYGQDEEKLLKEVTPHVYSSPNRVALARNVSPNFNLLILDDGFQHRKLHRDVNIVIMAAHELIKPIQLIPVSSFRESLNSLRRANILMISYYDEIDAGCEFHNTLLRKFPHLKIYYSYYEVKGFVDLHNNVVDIGRVKSMKIAAITAIGYPEGFFRKLAGLNIPIVRKIIYPDHYEFTVREFERLQDSLLDEGITGIVITHKDKYHIPLRNIRIDIFVLTIGLKIQNEKDFLAEINIALQN